MTVVRSTRLLDSRVATAALADPPGLCDAEGGHPVLVLQRKPTAYAFPLLA